MKKQLQGSLSLLICTMIWGSAFIAQSVGMDLIGPFTFQSIRCFLAVLFLFPMATLLTKNGGTFRESLRKWKDPTLIKAGLICGSILFIGASLQQIGLVYTDAGKAGFITAMYIVMVPLLGLFFQKKPPINAVISVIIAVIGLYMLSCMGVASINIGDIFLLAGALGFAIQITAVDRFAQSVDGTRLNCLQCLVIAVLSLPFMCITETIQVENIIACWFPLFYAGIFSMGIAYSLQIIGQKYVEPTAASLLMSLESVFAALGGWLILHETMNSRELTGCTLVFIAVIISQFPMGQLVDCWRSTRENRQQNA